VLIEWEFGSSNVGIVCDAVQCASVAGVACCVFCCVKKIPKTNQIVRRLRIQILKIGTLQLVSEIAVIFLSLC